MRHVERDAALAIAAKVLAERAPLEVHSRRQVQREALHRIPELVGYGRRREAAVPDHLGRDALPDLGLRAPIAPEPPIGVRVHVDEPRGDREAVGDDGPPRRLLGEIADGSDRVPDDADVSAPSRAAGPIDHAAADDLDVDHWTSVFSAPHGDSGALSTGNSRWSSATMRGMAGLFRISSPMACAVSEAITEASLVAFRPTAERWKVRSWRSSSWSNWLAYTPAASSSV